MEEKEKKPKKKTLLLLVCVFVAGFVVGGFTHDLWADYEMNSLLLKIEIMKKRMGHLDKLVEKEERETYIEKTLMVHYKLSEHEAHYYAIIMDDFAQQYGVPWQVYASMVRIESNFDPTRRSSKGARGMTQVMPKTGQAIAKRLNIPWRGDNATLWSEIPNMVIGFTYLGEAVKEKGIEDGFNTYIGGPGFDKGSKLVGDYRTTCRWEFERLMYIHHGVVTGAPDPDSIIGKRPE